MKKLFSISLLLLTVFMLSFISAEDCYGMDASCPDGFDVNCYQTDSYVAWECVSDGSSTGYNIMPDGDSWCDSDEVIDYNKDSCCPDNFPYLDNNLCYQSPSLDSNAKNYFTELFKCEPSSKKCDNKEQFLCVNSDNRDSDNIYIRETYYWQGIGKRIGVCDYQECYASDVKCVGFDYYVCENNKWLNTGKVNTKCNVECTDDSNCKADIFVVSYCENGQNKTNLLDYYCNETSFSCDKKSNVIADEFKVDVCGIECLEDTDCNLDYVNETCDGLDSVLRYTDNYCSENKCLINITEDNQGHLQDKCNVECFANIECVEYCDDKQPTCSDGICTCSYQIDDTNVFSNFLETKYIVTALAFISVGIYFLFRKTKKSKKRGKKRRS